MTATPVQADRQLYALNAALFAFTEQSRHPDSVFGFVYGFLGRPEVLPSSDARAWRAGYVAGEAANHAASI